MATEQCIGNHSGKSARLLTGRCGGIATGVRIGKVPSYSCDGPAIPGGRTGNSSHCDCTHPDYMGWIWTGADRHPLHAGSAFPHGDYHRTGGAINRSYTHRRRASRGGLGMVNAGVHRVSTGFTDHSCRRSYRIDAFNYRRAGGRVCQCWWYGTSSTNGTGSTTASGCKSSANTSSTANNTPVNRPISFSQQNHKLGGAAKAVQNVSIGLGYIPDIQFAPFYVAKSKGYYSAAGLNVTLQHGIVNDLLGSLALGHNTFAFTSGDELLVARSKNLPLIDVSTIFQKYPVSLIVPANSSICTLADLKGHTIGEPGPFGATYVGLLALLYHAHLSLSDVHAQPIGFTQVAALLGHKVDGVMGYSNNEPLQLSKHGFPVRTFDVSNYQPLISNGIITTENTWHNQPQLVRSFVQATIQGLQEVIA